MSVYAASVGELSRMGREERRRPSGLSVDIDSVDDEPITTTEAQDFARIDVAEQSVLMHDVIRGVREQVEKYTGRLMTRRQVTLTWEKFYGQARVLYPPFSESSLQVETKQDGTYDSVDSDDVTIENREVIVDGSVHETPARLTYQAGFRDLPPSLKVQMLRDIRAAFDHRDPVATDVGSPGLLTEDAYDQWALK
jgi:hypothetical protein